MSLKFFHPHNGTRTQVDELVAKILTQMGLDPSHQAVLSGFVAASVLFDRGLLHGTKELAPVDVYTHVLGAKFSESKLDEDTIKRLDASITTGLINIRFKRGAPIWELTDQVYQAARHAGHDLEYQMYPQAQVIPPSTPVGKKLMRAGTTA